MVLQLRELFQIEGMRFPIEYQIMPEELSGVHGYTFDGPVTVKSAEAVDKSYPDFWQDYESLGGILHVI